MLLSRGVNIDLLDRAGNSPLHYAAKAGAIDLCKLLVERGCSAARKNNSHQTPYDVAQNHVVRQFLLPIQLKIEAADPSYQAPLGISTEASYGLTHVPPPPIFGAPPPQMSMQMPTHTPAQYVPPMGVGMQTVDLSSPAHSMPYANGAVYPPLAPALPGVVPSSSSSRVIQPDGFHTSASDPLLQQKYGHVKQIGVVQQNGRVVHEAPPILGGSHFSGAYGAQPTTPQQQSVYSRYVAVDYATNTPIPAPPPQMTATFAPPPFSPAPPAIFYPQAPTQAQQQTDAYHAHPAVVPPPGHLVAPPPPGMYSTYVVPASSTITAPASSVTPLPQAQLQGNLAPITNRSLIGEGIPVNVGPRGLGIAVTVPVAQSGQGQNTSPRMVITEEVDVILSSTSNSVM